jgi:hypothetical protein
MWPVTPKTSGQDSKSPVLAYRSTNRCASSMDSGTPDRIHSAFSDWCQRSILPLDCG